MWSYRLVLASIAFWAPGLDATVLFWGLWEMGRYPVSIYREPVRWGLTYVIPVAFVATTPVQVLSHGITVSTAVENAVAVGGSVLLVTLVWRAGIRRYAGATT